MDESTEKYRAWVETNFKSDIKEQLFDIYKESMYDASADPSDQNGAGRISKTIAKASTLFARLSHDQEKIAKRLLCLTWVLAGLTAVLLVLTIYLYRDTHRLLQRDKSEHRAQPQKEEQSSVTPVPNT